MKYSKFLALIALSLVSAVHNEVIDDGALDVYDDLDPSELESEYGDDLTVESPLPIGWYDDKSPQELQARGVESTPSVVSETPDTGKLNRLSCPFSGKGCRFKKAKCLCETKDSKFKFTMKKFKMVDDDEDEQEEVDEDDSMSVASDVSTVPSEYSTVSSDEESVQEYGSQALVEEPTEFPVIEEIVDQPTNEDILDEIPSVVEGFESLEKVENPTEIFQEMEEYSGPEPIVTEPSEDFEDKIIRVSTADDQDARKKLREYEYLRVKKSDGNEVEEQHMETPETQNPSVSYHKGLMEPTDLSLKSKLGNLVPSTYSTTPSTEPTLLAIESAPIQTEVNGVPYVDVNGLSLAKKHMIENLKKTDLEIERIKKEEELRKKIESAEIINKELMEIEKRKEDLEKHKDLSVAVYTPPTTDMRVVPYKQAGPVALRGLKLNRSLKSKKKNKKPKKSKEMKRLEKEKKKIKKQRKKEEKKRLKNLKKKSRTLDEVDERRDTARLERLREQEKLLDEKLDKLSEDLEAKQIAASNRARQVQSLQLKKERQERIIDNAEKRVRIKRDQRKKLEAKERLERIKKEQDLLKEQEEEIDHLTKETLEDSRKLFENSMDDDY